MIWTSITYTIFPKFSKLRTFRILKQILESFFVKIVAQKKGFNATYYWPTSLIIVYQKLQYIFCEESRFYYLLTLENRIIFLGIESFVKR